MKRTEAPARQRRQARHGCHLPLRQYVLRMAFEAGVASPAAVWDGPRGGAPTQVRSRRRSRRTLRRDKPGDDSNDPGELPLSRGSGRSRRRRPRAACGERRGTGSPSARRCRRRVRTACAVTGWARCCRSPRVMAGTASSSDTQTVAYGADQVILRKNHCLAEWRTHSPGHRPGQVDHRRGRVIYGPRHGAPCEDLRAQRMATRMGIRRRPKPPAAAPNRPARAVPQCGQAPVASSA